MTRYNYEQTIFVLVERMFAYHKLKDKSSYILTLAKLELTLAEYYDIFYDEYPIKIIDYYAKLWEF